jgi:hypothetical protein
LGQNPVPGGDDHRQDQNRSNNHDGVGYHLFTAGPIDLLEFGGDIPKETLKPFKPGFFFGGLLHSLHPSIRLIDLSGFFVTGFLAAELAIFHQFQALGIVLFVFVCAVVAVFALRASQRDSFSHL